VSNARYPEPVAGLDGEQLAKRMQGAMYIIETLFPEGTGLCIFAFDVAQSEGKGFAYIANTERASTHNALREYLKHHASKS
jgi:hypothetical protein